MNASIAGKVGLWTMSFDLAPWTEVRAAVRDIDSQGWSTLWIPESFGREVLSLAGMILASTERIAVATGIANLWARDAVALANGQRGLCEAFPDRFLLGIGVSHERVARVRGADFARSSPVETMANYLDALDAAPYHGARPESTPRVLAALGPKMLALAAERSLGAHTYNAPVAHTAWARAQLGPGPLLVPEVKVVLNRSASDAREVARASLPTRLPAYAANLRRSGFEDRELDAPISDRVVDALVAHGDVDAVAARVEEHLSAGADQVCINVLVEEGRTPAREWEQLRDLAAR